MTILKFLLVVILLLILIPVVRIGMMLWSMRRTLRDAREAARRMYGDGPFRQRDNGDRPFRQRDNGGDLPQGEYADFEEIPGERPADTGVGATNATGSASQVVEAEFEEI